VIFHPYVYSYFLIKGEIFMIDVFNNYLQKFDLTDANIIRKVKHSKEVRNLIKDLAKELNFNEEEIFISEQIGILHDIGRFQE